MRRPGTRGWRWAILAAWVGAVLLTQAWPTWATGIRDLFASDVTSYEQIAQAAPGLPSAPLPAQHAGRFPAHWLVGTIADLTGVGIHSVYRVFSLLALLAILLVMHRILVKLGVSLGVYAICIGCLAACAYPTRYALAAPGMLSDAVFVLGLTVVALGFVEASDSLVVCGVAVAALGRQTAVPLAIAAALCLLLTRKRPEAIRSAVLTVAVGGGIVLAEWLVARTFSSPDLVGFTIFSALGHPIRLVTRQGVAGFDARALLGLLVPFGLIAGAWLRGYRPALVPAVLAASVVVQPLLLAPAWVGPNETRLAALALPAVVAIAACQLRTVELPHATVAIVVIATLLASFHARYSRVGVPDSAAWAVLDAGAAVSIALAVGWPRISQGRRANNDSAPIVT